MERRARAEPGLLRGLGYAGLAATVAGLVLLAQQLLLGGQLERVRLGQLAGSVAFQLRLVSLGLERFAPRDLAELSGLRLAVGALPEPRGRRDTRAVAGRLGPVALALQAKLCQRLPHCPRVRPAAGGDGLWVEAESPLETVWLLAPWPALAGWPPGPLALMVAMTAAGLSVGLAFLLLEVQRPLQRLERALAQVELTERPRPLPVAGARPVRQLTDRFNAMLLRLETSSRERAAMLSGIAHDLRSPTTRLRLRLEAMGQGPSGADLARQAHSDLDALERITRQFLLFAGAVPSEAALEVPLEELLAEASAALEPASLQLDLEPVRRRVRPLALARAVANLLDNAMTYGKPPATLRLRAEGLHGFRITVADRGTGIAPADWQRAVQPFQRLDQARGGSGHCGLGLAIAEQVARDHGGALQAHDGDGEFGVVLTGQSLDPA